ncbi:ArnT family glycosyltransferase [Aggregatilinea lenta]|uniref:ArnT family glycosyltransferase n=1 Tax=Aggregatilinea lenta TaxID=913108 RepID=UPI0013C32198|nr:glycosyltransferase family 39 protein [Aggregatilinea lenta]
MPLGREQNLDELSRASWTAGRRTRLWIALAILLVAAGARLWAFGDVPPGLQHDEIFKAEEGRRLAEYGDFRLFYPSNQGHEGLYIWLLSGSYRLFGASLMMIKFPAFACGMLTVALLYRVLSELYGGVVGATASGLAAISFWAIFTSRVGLRAVTLPLVVLLVVWGVYHLIRPSRRPDQPHGRRWALAVGTGLALGLAIYTYTSSVVVYIAYALFVVGLTIVDRAALRRRLPELALVAFLGTVLALPMVTIRITDPQGLNRAQTINRPWEEFKQGRPEELLDNARGLAGMLAFTGDPEWRYNVAGRALFVLPVGLLGYLGLGVAARRARRQAASLLLVLLAGIGLIPSLVTVSAPSFLRSVVMLPSVMAFVALGTEQVGRWTGHRRAARWVVAVGAVVIGITAAADLPAYFHTWPRSDAVQAIYRGDLARLAADLRARDETTVFVSTPNRELDPLLYNYSNPPDDTQVVFFDAYATVVLRDQPVMLYVSPLSPLSPPHADWLTEANGTVYEGQLLRKDGDVAFDLYRLSAQGDALAARLAQVSALPVYLPGADEIPSLDLAAWAEAAAYPVNFGDVVQLAGIEIPREQVSGQNDGVNLQLYLQPLVSRLDQSLNVFVHLLAPDGRIVAQRDLLGVSPLHWQAGMTILQDNYVPFWTPVPAGQYVLSMGVYNWRTGERLPVLGPDGSVRGDHVLLGTVEVVAAAQD